MGCDIHVIAEKKNPKTGKRNLLKKDMLEVDTYDEEHEPDMKGRLYERMPGVLSPIGERNSYNFRILAGVGDFHNTYVPMQKHRGIPQDSCDIVHSRVNQREGDAHNKGRLTFREILDYEIGEQDVERITVINSIKEFQNTSKIKDMSLFRLVFFFDN